jgi:hypothetical protein
MSLRVEVSLFVARPEIEDRDEVGVATGRSTKRPSKKSDMNSFIFFCCSYNDNFQTCFCFFRGFFNRDNSNDLTFDSVEPVDISTPRI